jgi:ubiquinone/menaquinone biosynthesis C-methylase UbiE
MNKLAIKLEREERLLELKPLETLKEFGFSTGMNFCDLGAGSGVFSLEAAKISKETIYALEISDEMIDIITKKIKISNITNVFPKKIVGKTFGLPSKSIDFVLLSTVFHEIPKEEHPKFLSEIKRVLKDNGRFLVIEFLKEKSPMGPRLVEKRVSKEEMNAIVEKHNFLELKHKVLGENLYAVLFEKVAK